MTPTANFSKSDMIKEIPIESILGDMGITVKKKGDKYICSSPLSEDRNPSFVIYPENTFYDWSTGIGGTVVDFVMNYYGLYFYEALDMLEKSTYMNGFSEENLVFKTKEKSSKKKKVKFNPANLLVSTNEDIQKIRDYMFKRKFVEFNTLYCKYHYLNDAGDWEKNLAVGFIHKDEYGEICGVKMRNISDNTSNRFSARGRLFFYEMHSATEVSGGYKYQERVYLVESETSANSLYRFLLSKKADNLLGDFTVLSFGGVTSIPKTLPLKYEHIKDRRIIIDYDGNEELYNKRIENFSHLNAKPIKLELDKGVDINKLYIDGKLNDYSKIILYGDYSK